MGFKLAIVSWGLDIEYELLPFIHTYVILFHYHFLGGHPQYVTVKD